MTDKSIGITRATLWDWVKALCTLIVVGVLSYKVYITPIDLTVDFPTLLSLLLALFSVGLAALFYFKATETSNKFYDNTNNFTKDIAQLLVRIESGFGEKLRNLDEGYSSMRDYLQNTPNINKEIIKTEEKIEGEEQEIEKVLEERKEIVAKLFEHSQLEKAEKEKISSQLKEKENELVSSQKELSRMHKRLFMDRMRKNEGRNFEHGFEEYTYNVVIPKIGAELILTSGSRHLRRRINEQLNDEPRAYIKDLERGGYIDEGLSPEGLKFFIKLANMHAGVV